MNIRPIAFCLFTLTLFFTNSASSQILELFKKAPHRTVSLTPEAKKIEADILTLKKSKADIANTYYWYDNQNIHETKGGFSGYLLDGNYKEYYYPGNNLSVTGQFKRGLKSGQWKYWDDKGQIKEYSEWKKGRLDGTRSNYNKNSTLASTEEFDNGVLDGEKIFYNADTISRTEHYKNGVLVKFTPSLKKKWYSLQFLKRQRKDESSKEAALKGDKKSKGHKKDKHTDTKSVNKVKKDNQAKQKSGDQKK